MSTYPRDEFDNIPESSSRQGVHRTATSQPRSGLWAIIGFALVALLVGVLAFLVLPPIIDPARETTAAPNSSTEPTQSETSEPPTDETPSDSPAASAPTSSEQPSSPEPSEPTAQIDRTQPVGVYNSTLVSGLAGQVAAQLQSQGWTIGASANWTGGVQPASLVYYRTPELKANADQIAASLGIATVVESATAELPVMVILGSDAQG